MSRKPLIVGLGGTIRAGSSTEKALVCALKQAEALGAETRLLGGEFLGGLPIFDPRPGESTAAQLELADAIRAADGVIVASPGYHGSISGVIKNALDTLELTRSDPAPYLTAKPVGTIITADGWQAAGTTLMALRAIIHALRGGRRRSAPPSTPEPASSTRPATARTRRTPGNSPPSRNR